MKENQGKFGLRRRNLALIFSKVKISNSCIVQCICIEVSYYHSSKSISRSKNLMYTTISSRKFKEKVYNRKQWINFRVLMKRKYATQSGNLNSTTQKKLAKTWLNLALYETTTLWKFQNELITKISFIIFCKI